MNFFKKMTLIEWMIIIAIVGMGVAVVGGVLAPDDEVRKSRMEATKCSWWGGKFSLCVCLGEADLGKRSWAFTAPARVCDGEPSDDQ